MQLISALLSGVIVDCRAGSKANNRVTLNLVVNIYMYHPTSIHKASEMQFNDVITWKCRMCVLKFIYGKRCTCARALTIFHGTFWPMLIGEESKPGLGIKDIGRLMETVNGQLMLQGVARERTIHGADYCQNVGMQLHLHNACINSMLHLRPTPCHMRYR